MTLRQLEILRAVIRYQTTMAAARMLGMSQPAVSNAVKQAESQLGVPLFERINNRLFPTEAGRLVYAESEALFTMHAALEGRLQGLRQDSASRLRILSTPPLGHGAIPRALQRMLRRQPRLQVSFDVRHLDEVIAGVESGEAELGFGLSLGDQPNLHLRPLTEQRMVCVCTPHHALTRHAVITPAELQHFPFIALDGGTRMGAALRQAFVAARQPFNFTVEVRYCNTACVLAESGVGVAVVDPFSARSGRGLVTLPFEPATPSVAYAFWAGRKPLSQTAEALLREVRAAID
jgi:DNA-binding transcriptional LysR family regulator